MDIQLANPILDAIITIYEKAKGSKLEPVYFESVKSELSIIHQYFNRNSNESFLMALLVAAQAENASSADFGNLAKHIDCSKLKLLSYSKIVDDLIEIGYLEKCLNGIQARLLGLNSTSFLVNKKIIDAIMSNEPMPVVEKIGSIDVFRVLELVYTLGLERDENKFDTYRIIKSIKILLKNNEHLPLLKKLSEYNLEPLENYIFLYAIWKRLNGTNKIDIYFMLSGIYNDISVRFNIMQEFLAGTHVLVKQQLIEILPAEMTNDTEFQLSEYAISLLNDLGLSLTAKVYKRKDIIEPKDIMEKNLIFHESELQQIDTLRKLLLAEPFEQMQERLKSKGLPSGVTVLLHGSPGTGKTEIARQIAKQTGRELMHVNISQCKTMWYGESEKLIKKIFTEYNSYAKNSAQKPILFFNEADAIIGKRRELKGNNIDQTENTIQNILLEEMEVFGGILLATTNLVNNIDAAFDRRFLYKIEFKKPGLMNRAKIWQLKLPELANTEANQLAEGFHFSGGQIDNIIRKKEINELLHGNTTTFEQIISFCQEETFQTNINKIGFKQTTQLL